MEHAPPTPRPLASEPGRAPARGRGGGAGTSRDRSRIAAAWYEVVRYTTLMSLSLWGGLRVTGRRNLPSSGGVLLVSNHLSHLDVFVLGTASNRPLNYVARSTLFKPVLGPLIRSVGAFPIDREGGGVGGLKETLRRLKAGKVVLIFPEGTRSRDGEIGPIKPGIAALARAGVPFVPVAVAGTYEALPPGRLVPKKHPIHVHYGSPLRPDECAGLSPGELTGRIRDRMLEAQRQARHQMARLVRPSRSF